MNEKPQFEEKQFEQPLNEELSVRRMILPVGQVREAAVGLDGRLFSRNTRFWRLWSPRWWLAPILAPRPGIPLDSSFWQNAAESLDNSLLRFKFNVFVQHKRPSYIRSKRGPGYRWWKREFYRYSIDPDQQKKLEAQEKLMGRRGVVVYACPAFWSLADLLRHQFEGKLVEHTNFVQPREITGHKRYTFIEAGKNGKAFSEPSDVEHIDILRTIDALAERPAPFETNSTFLDSLGRDIGMIRERTRGEFWDTFDQVYAAIGQPETEFGMNVIRIGLYILMTGVSWLVGYEVRG